MGQALTGKAMKTTQLATWQSNMSHSATMQVGVTPSEYGADCSSMRIKADEYLASCIAVKPIACTAWQGPRGS